MRPHLAMRQVRQDAAAPSGYNGLWGQWALTVALASVIALALLWASLLQASATRAAPHPNPVTQADQASCPVVWAAAGPDGATLLPNGIADNQFADLFIAVPRSTNPACAGQHAVLTVTVRAPHQAQQTIFTAAFTFPRQGKPTPAPFTVVWLDGAAAVAYYTFTASVTTVDGRISYGSTTWGTVLVGVAMHNALCQVRIGPNAYQSAVCDGAYYPQIGPAPTP